MTKKKKEEPKIKIAKVFPTKGIATRMVKSTPHYFLVMVHPTKEGMYEMFRELNPYSDDTKPNFGAIVMPQEKIRFKKDGTEQISPCLGYALFYLEKINLEICVHESVHMTSSYLRRVQQTVRLSDSDIDDTEEIFAYTLGNCFSNLIKAIYE